MKDFTWRGGTEAAMFFGYKKFIAMFVVIFGLVKGESLQASYYEQSALLGALDGKVFATEYYSDSQRSDPRFFRTLRYFRLDKGEGIFYEIIYRINDDETIERITLRFKLDKIGFIKFYPPNDPRGLGEWNQLTFDAIRCDQTLELPERAGLKIAVSATAGCYSQSARESGFRAQLAKPASANPPEIFQSFQPDFPTGDFVFSSYYLGEGGEIGESSIESQFASLVSDEGRWPKELRDLKVKLETHGLLHTTAPPQSPGLNGRYRDAYYKQNERHALVIGNSTYSNFGGALTNPVNDAELIAAELSRAGFKVNLIKDATRAEMYRAARDFGIVLQESGKDAIGLFYFAGHGIQFGGNNYLIPIDAKIQRPTDLSAFAFEVNSLLIEMEAAENSINFIILDACRNSPFATGTRGAAPGLARIDPPPGSFIAYSTAPGMVALDGDGEHSPFAESLAKNLSTTNLRSEILFRNVRRDVLAATDSFQRPWDTSSITETFIFRPDLFAPIPSEF